MAQLTQDEAVALEALVDRCDLETVVDALGLICAEKAEHLRSNWQDGASAKLWDKRCRALQKLAAQIERASDG